MTKATDIAAQLATFRRSIPERCDWPPPGSITTELKLIELREQRLRRQALRRKGADENIRWLVERVPDAREMATAPTFAFVQELPDQEEEPQTFGHPFPHYWIETRRLSGLSLIYVDANAATAYGWRWNTMTDPDGTPRAVLTNLALILRQQSDEGWVGVRPPWVGDDVIDPLLLGWDLLWGLAALNRQPVIAPEDPVSQVRRRMMRAKGVTGRTFHVLKVNLAAAPTPASEAQGGTHASPREHDRRGHWRRLASGRTVWVRACRVGDLTRGAVHKDYVVTAK